MIFKIYTESLERIRGRNRNSTVTAGDFNALSQQLEDQTKITHNWKNKKVKREDLKRLNHLDTVDIYRTLYPIIIEFFSMHVAHLPRHPEFMEEYDPSSNIYLVWTPQPNTSL